MNYLKSVLFISLLAIFSYSCNGNSSKDGGDDDTTSVIQQIQNAPADETAVCLWSSLTVKERPAAKGKYKNTIYLGEKVIFMKESVTDSTDKKNKRDYIKVKLTDGSQGWVQANMMVIGAKSYVIKDKTKLYKRPDILSAGKDEFDKMQFVVVPEEQGDWVKVKGKKSIDKWFKEGWIKRDRLVETEVDVTVAILTERALIKDTEEKRLEALKEIIDNSDFSSSIFIEDVRNIINTHTSETIQENKTDQPVDEYYEGD